MTKDTEVLAKWFLNVLNAITKSEEMLPILKIRIFDTSQANAFKSDKEKCKFLPEYERKSGI